MLVLVVEDDADLRAALVESLENDGMTVALARDGQDALDWLRGGLRPAVVLLDLLMPGIDGVGFRERQLREEFSDIPVVVMTGDLTRSEKLAPLGFASVLKKPYGPEKLVRALREAARSNDAEV